jgi:hypothetical protein
VGCYVAWCTAPVCDQVLRDVTSGSRQLSHSHSVGSEDDGVTVVDARLCEEVRLSERRGECSACSAWRAVCLDASRAVAVAHLLHGELALQRVAVVCVGAKLAQLLQCRHMQRGCVAAARGGCCNATITNCINVAHTWNTRVNRFCNTQLGFSMYTYERLPVSTLTDGQGRGMQVIVMDLPLISALLCTGGCREGASRTVTWQTDHLCQIADRSHRLCSHLNDGVWCVVILQLQLSQLEEHLAHELSLRLRA